MARNQKPKKDSLITLTKKYANNHDECVKYFFKMKWPVGFYCEKCGCTHYYSIKRGDVFQCKECGHQHYLLSNTIFQDNKLDLYKLILGMYLFFTANKGLSAIELANELEINYKTALLLCRKCRILMSQSNSEKILDSFFYEADVAYIGSKSKEEHKQGVATEQQPFLVMLSTDKENKYPKFLKLMPVAVDSTNNIVRFISKKAILSKERILNTDGKTTFLGLADKITLKSEKILYDEENHRLYWLNVLIGDIKNNITGICHGVTKRDLPLFLNEQEWRFNHRYTGKNFMNKIQKYVLKSHPCPKKAIITVLNLSEPYYAHVSDG